MPYIATQSNCHQTRDYIMGDPIKNISIVQARWYYLLAIAQKQDLTVAFRDPDNNNWTKWVPFPGLLMEKKTGNFNCAIDVHRSILTNEIVIESDYPTYEENYEAAVVIGKIIESKGFIPHYYYSGNKSIHCLPCKTQVFIKNRLGVRKVPLDEVERLLRTDQYVEILGPNGFIKVLQATRRKQTENENLVRIYTRNGKRIDMSQDHLQIINRKHSIITVQAKDILPSDRILYSLQGYEGNGGTYDLGRFLGLFLAEGSVKNGNFQFTLDATEMYLMKFIQKVIEPYGSILKIKKEDNCLRGRFMCKTMEAFVNDFSIGNTAKLKGIKANAYGMSKEFRTGILDGWFEGDGGHKTKNNGVTISSGLAKAMIFLCTSVGIRASKHCYIGKSSFSSKPSRFYRIRKIENRQGTSTVCTLPNYSCAFDTIKYVNKVFTKKTDLIDIEVDSNDHLFCLANGIITHNCHVFFDWNCLLNLEPIIGTKVHERYTGSTAKFKTAFIKWLRKKMISCWDTEAKIFDTDLINASHLIRAELSKNKRGYKCFLGYTWKDVSPVPYVCNEENEIYPELGGIRLSKPNNISGLVEEFLDDVSRKTAAEKRNKCNRSLSSWNKFKNSEELRPCVKFILSDEFKVSGDGFSRAMFILVNMCKKKYDDDTARDILYDWNQRMGSPQPESEIDYRLKKKTYNLNCEYIHKFLAEIGYDVSQICKG